MSPFIASSLLLKTVPSESRRPAHGLSAHQLRDLGLSTGQAYSLATSQTSLLHWRRWLRWLGNSKRG